MKSPSREDEDVDSSQSSEKNEDEVVVLSDDLEKSKETVTPKKNTSAVKKEPGSSRKKTPAELQKAREEREKKRQEEKDAKEKLKQEKKEQKIKERQEKEEQKIKERQEKEEQKKKEKLEKEEQKRKEKEEKEEQKRKEKEEKDEQRKKEREEKEEQKRKEKEEKELKKQQELEKDKKKMEKESAAFVKFFSRKSTSTPEPEKLEEAVSSFMPFQVKADMRLAPATRTTLSTDQKDQLTDKITKQNEINLYLTEVKTKTFTNGEKTWPVNDDDVIVVEDTGLGECVEEQPTKNIKIRAKFLQFHENQRPAYFGTWRKKSKHVGPRKPLGLDKETFDYEVDSDDDWEEEEPGESLHGSDDEEKENEPDDEYEVDNEFFVPHGYLSDEEAENEENMELTPETQKEKLKILQMEFEEEMKSKTERIKPRLIGCIWESKLKPKIQDAITSFLEERMMIISGPIVIKKRELNKENNQNSAQKNSTPTRKQLNKELIPEFVRMIHGNTNNKVFLVNEFIHFLSAQNKDVQVSKSGLMTQMKELAVWKKCPDEGMMFNKNCWYVEEDVRKQYNLNLVLPNRWSYSEENSVARKKLSL